MTLRTAIVSLLAPLVLASVVAVPGAQSLNTVSSLRQALQAKFDELHAASQFPGGTLGVALDGGETIALATGVSDRTTKRPMQPTDLLLMGSVGKTYVAAVALQLVHEGTLSLDDPIEKWLGKESWFPRLPNAKAVTIRHLMTHTSGLVRYEFKEQFTIDLTRQPDKVWRPEDLLSYLLDATPPFAPGQGWEYSDTNYIVLGMIIERATRSTYYAELRSRLLEPLKLNHTRPSDSRMIPGLVQGYAGPRNPFGGTDEMIADGKFVINPQFEWTGGGLASTGEDLARWAKALYEGRAFAPALLPLMLNGVPARLGPGTQYGLGVILRTTPHGQTYGHSGFFPGYLTEMMYFPKAKVAIAVQINSSAPRSTTKPLVRFLYDFADIVMGPPRA